ncbi:hypothetical protein E2C01_004265 [Portunus trituberculatus]|uniref:Uncharacterized protein n=1 Tax=Portunus trituberculatus TaxID=210409 RepID=A0A5B7CQY2_PORTR|nr:hypothetical protein [Portunus trituberculatus]
MLVHTRVLGRHPGSPSIPTFGYTERKASSLRKHGGRLTSLKNLENAQRIPSVPMSNVMPL